jgi:hypothetical protein
MEEHREAKRRRVLKSGKILLIGGGAIDCTVRNLSQTGAALEVVTPIGIPERFALAIEPGQTLTCEVVRRTERRVGVRFVNLSLSVGQLTGIRIHTEL